MKILYLYSELLGYNLPIFDRLVQHYGASVDVIHWSQNKLTPFVPGTATGVTFHDRSSFSDAGMLDFAVGLAPDLVYVVGWMDSGYLLVSRKLKSLGIPIVTGMDSQWTGSLRQQLGGQLIRWFYKKRYFSFAWVPGPMQYEYAARIGFKKTEILSNLLTGNSALFAQAADVLETEKKISYPKTFLYVGRFAETKGIDILAAAYAIYKEKYHGDWGLTCIGNGPLAEVLTAAQSRHPDLQIEPFLVQPELVRRARAAGAFVLPSRAEPWGVVVHEFATAGLPLILSENVGARSQFLIDQYNGFTFFENSANDLAYKMHLMSACTTAQLVAMGLASAALAAHITPAITTASLMSVLTRDEGAGA